MTIEADAIVLGRVTRVTLTQVSGPFRISRATIRVRRWIHGGRGRVVYVYHFSKTDNAFNLPIKLSVGERVLLFLRHRSQVRSSAPLMASGTATAAEYVLQFAKARNVGYKLTVTARGKLKGFMAAADPRTLPKALKIIRAHLPGRPVSGLRGLLWAHDRSAPPGTPLHLELSLRNTTKRTVRLFTYRRPDMVYLHFTDSRGRKLGKLEVYRHLRVMKRRGPSLGDVNAIAPGGRHRFRFSVRLNRLKLPRGSIKVRAKFTRGRPSLGGLPARLWRGKLITNALVIKR